MLLNQCLAISLSPLANAISHQETSVNQESAQKIFQQLIAENCQLSSTSKVTTLRAGEKLQERDDTSTLDSHEAITRLKQGSTCGEKSLDRLELAGFVLPNWMLVSGPIADLEHLTKSWSAGLLKAPLGLRLETVGNIRSVSIDYLEISPNQQYQLDSLVLSAICDLTSQTCKPIHISQLMEHLDLKLDRFTLVGPLDRVINDLVRSNRIRALPMTQQQVAEALARQQCQRRVTQSVFLDKLLEQEDVEQRGAKTKASCKSSLSDESRNSLDRTLSTRFTRKNEVSDFHKINKLADHPNKSSSSFWRSRSLRVPTCNRLIDRSVNKYMQTSTDCLSTSRDQKHESPTARLGFFFRRLFSSRLRRRRAYPDVNKSQLDRSSSPTLIAGASIDDKEKQTRSPVIAAKKSNLLDSSDSSSTSSLFEPIDGQLKAEYSCGSAIASCSINSSGSRNSINSCYTTKSSASQQLRRHLDEASRRHRVCTNQSERDFIDSINILRQASRHADQNSVSSSKNRRNKPTTNGEETDSGSGSGCCTPPSSGSFRGLKPIDCLRDENLCSDCQLFSCTSESCCYSANSDGIGFEFATPNPCCPIWRSLLASYWLPEQIIHGTSR